MYDDKMTYAQNIPKMLKKDKSTLIVIVLIILSLIVAYFLFFKDILKNKNTKMEDKMVVVAKDYVLRNNITTTKEIYFDVSKLNITLDDNCSLTSGVIFDGENYIPNLICTDYRSEVIINNKDITNYITLKGDEVIILARGMNYFEPGYISSDLVITTGKVGTEEGVYNLYYKTKNSNNVAVRKVIIINSQEINNLFPTISLNGEELIYLVKGNNYIDEGITGRDIIDGDISNKVIIDGVVDTNIEGEYTLNYILTNSRGYSNSITRKVVVLNEKADLTIGYTLNPSTLTNEDVTIKLSINNEFKKIIYPDGREGVNLTYDVNENGIYKFSIYDMYDRIIEKEIEIDNIDRTKPEGSCIATMYYNNTKIETHITTTREISTYEYIVNGISAGVLQSNNYVSSTIKPNIVKVKIRDSINNQNELTCSLVDQSTRKIVTDSKGKNCLEGYTCYIQLDYTDTSRYPYCSMDNNPNTCGGIWRSGCSITSATNVIASMGIKSKNGQLYNPYTVWEELYPVNKKTGQCNGGCSGWSRIRDSVVNAGLSAPRKVINLDKNNMYKLTDHLKKGYPAIVWAGSGPFAASKGHYMTILAIREDGYVFLSDSSNRSGTNKAYYKGKQYYVDTWISTDDLLSGNADVVLLVGPYGMYEGK